jgi:hypothetical protein
VLNFWNTEQRDSKFLRKFGIYLLDHRMSISEHSSPNYTDWLWMKVALFQAGK